MFDPTGQLTLETEQSGYTATGDNQHIVVRIDFVKGLKYI